MSDANPVALTDPAHPLVELEKFGNYRLVGSLAKGGMAELSLAVQTGMEGFSRVVALKRVLPEYAANGAFLEMFLDEARLAARLDHPSIVRIYEFGQEQGRYFMSMEYLPGEDLAHVLSLATSAGLHISPEIAATIVERAAEALQFAHELTDASGKPLGLVHRDVNPSNVLLTYTGYVKVVDFGIAKASNNSFQTEAGALKGKMGYLAAEQLDGSTLDRRCDVFGLGIILWELLAGQRLFQRDTHAETLSAIHDGVVPSLHDFRDDVDDELEAIALKALSRNRDDRFQTAALMQEALDQYLRSRTDRPNERELTRWLELLGGPRRAELKRAIARGSQVLLSYKELRSLAPGTGPGGRASNPIPLVDETEPPRPLWQVGVFALAGLVALGGAAWFATRPLAPAVVAETRASAEVVSDPPGAFIFANGEPTGRVTPATFSGLDPAKPLKLRVEKRGFAPGEATLELEAGKPAVWRFSMVAVGALVSFSRAPPGGTVRLNGRVVAVDELLEVAPGKVQVEVTVAGKVTLNKELELKVGPQAIDLSP